MFDQFEDLNTRPLQARLAKQILLLARSYGIQRGDEIRIGRAVQVEFASFNDGELVLPQFRPVGA